MFASIQDTVASPKDRKMDLTLDMVKFKQLTPQKKIKE